MDYAGRKILVIGMGKSGLAAASALTRRGGKVTICDKNPDARLPEELAGTGIEVVAGAYPEGRWDYVVTSPGVPLSEKPLRDALEQGIPVLSELELGYRIKHPGVHIAAVTGTNGKTTTTALLAQIFAAAGHASRAAGNIGVPLVSVTEELKEGWVACEVSSFQLETIHQFKPDVAGILNITPDHLDRHHDIGEYTRIKARIAENQGPGQSLILNHDDERVRQIADTVNSRVVFFSSEEKVKGGVYARNGVITSDFMGIGEIIPFSSTRLRGRHNLENALCATAMSLAAGIPVEGIRTAMSTFAGVRHRLEEVAVKRGVLYINDSKGTNPDSTIKALQSFDNPIILIAGGRHKGGDLTELAALAAKKVRALVLLGEARNIIKEKMLEAGVKGIIEVSSLQEAVREASRIARPGEVVLLSPACASWDMFSNYEERGDLFCSLVRKLDD